jgi:cell division protein DivIC
MSINQPNPFKLLIRKLPPPLRNKYFLVLVIFAILLIFVDKHDLWTQWQLRGSVKRLEHDKVYYDQKIQEAKQDQKNVEENKEQFAREKYNMHKKDEDVFIIQDEK